MQVAKSLCMTNCHIAVDTFIFFEIDPEFENSHTRIYDFIAFIPISEARSIRNSLAALSSLGICPSRMASLSEFFRSPTGLDGGRLNISMIISPVTGGCQFLI